MAVTQSEGIWEVYVEGEEFGGQMLKGEVFAGDMLKGVVSKSDI